MRLSKCYRLPPPIARMCNALLPSDTRPKSLAGKGTSLILPYDLISCSNPSRNGAKSPICTHSRHHPYPASSASLDIPSSRQYTSQGCKRHAPDEDRVVVGGYHVMKGLEFDAVAVVWPDCELSEEEQRRLYTACSRALHGLCLFSGEKLIKELGIVL